MREINRKSNKKTLEPTADSPLCSLEMTPWELVGWSGGAIIGLVFFYLVFGITFPTAVAAISAGCLCSLAFLKCPSIPCVPKAMTIAFLVLGLHLGVNILGLWIFTSFL